MYKLTLKDGEGKIYESSSRSVVGSWYKMSMFIVSKYQIKLRLN
jgi:hypothetical protein